MLFNIANTVICLPIVINRFLPLKLLIRSSVTLTAGHTCLVFVYGNQWILKSGKCVKDTLYASEMKRTTGHFSHSFVIDPTNRVYTSQNCRI